jgi:hypothetical protein
VTVPRRMAPDWLVGPNGEVRPEFAADYRLGGRSASGVRQRTRDHDDAFANRAPSP